MKNNKFLVVSRQDFPLSIEDGKAAKLSILWCQPFRGLSEKLQPARGWESSLLTAFQSGLNGISRYRF